MEMAALIRISFSSFRVWPRGDRGETRGGTRPLLSNAVRRLPSGSHGEEGGKEGFINDINLQLASLKTCRAGQRLARSSRSRTEGHGVSCSCGRPGRSQQRESAVADFFDTALNNDRSGDNLRICSRATVPPRTLPEKIRSGSSSIRVQHVQDGACGIVLGPQQRFPDFPGRGSERSAPASRRFGKLRIN